MGGGYKEAPHGSAEYAFDLFETENKNTNILITNHWHDDTEILYVVKGVLFVNTANNSYEVHPGDILVVNSGEMHEMYGKNTDLKYYAFVFDMKSLSFMLDDASQKNIIAPLAGGRYSFDGFIRKSGKYAEILEEIACVNKEKSAGYMLITKADLLKFVALCAAEGRIKHGGARAEDETLKRIILYINTHFCEKITLDEIAREFNMSPKHFCRFFKSNFRRTFVEYVNAIRIENAMHMLEKKDVSVTDAALACGFSNMSYFARLFKSTVGCTPREYRGAE